jgi:predicted metalloprotease with PDZ domain
MKTKFLRPFLLSLACLSTFAHAEVKYQIKVTNAAQHLAEVQVEFPKVSQKTLDVQLPIWRTGRYEVLNLAKNIRQFSAVSGSGKPLSFAKTDKGTWQVQTKPGETVKVKYELYANALGERTQHLDDTHAYLDASGVMMYAAPFRNQAVSVQLDVPKNWVSRSGMEKGSCNHCFVAPNYDILIDSPIETGEHEFYSFDHEGRTFELAIWGRGNHDGKKIIQDLKKIVIETKKALGDWPFEKRYLFIVHAGDGIGGATEHINSTVISKGRWGFSARKDYISFLNTAAHEFVHTWNVKAYRPKEMVPYQYQAENYNRLLWIAEGHTSYFNDLITLRSGIMTREEFLESKANDLLAYQHQPGRFHQSAAESSFDAWIDQNGSERAKNASVNIYSKGELLGVVMDIEIRRLSNGLKGLEHVHQYLYEHHTVAKGGYSEADVRTALKKVSGQDWTQWWADYVDGVKELPMDKIYEQVGLKHVVEGSKDDTQKEEYFTGFRFRDSSESVLLSDIERDSPAWQAGLVAGDSIVAVNGLRVSTKDINDKLWLQQSLPIKLHVFRRDELREILFYPKRQTKGKVKLKAIENMSEAQKDLNAKWLGLPVPSK